MRSILALTAPVLWLAAAPLHAETLLKSDATSQPAAPVSAHLRLGTPTGPGGHTIGVNNQYDGDRVTYVFEAQTGIAPEFAFDKDVTALSGSKATLGGHVVVSDVAPGRGPAITIGKVSIVVLSPEDAQRLTVLDYAGRRRLILSDALVFGEGGHLDLRSSKPDFAFGIYPPLPAAPRASLPLALVKTGEGENGGIFQTFQARAKAVSPRVTVEKIRDAGQAPPLVIGGVAHAALQPYPEVYGRSAAWRITVDPKAMAGVANAWLDIKYQGDVGRLFAGTRMIDDQFWYGPDWVVGLKGRDLRQPFILTVLPLRADAPVYIDAAFRPKADQVAEVQSISVVPEYELTLEAKKK